MPVEKRKAHKITIRLTPGVASSVQSSAAAHSHAVTEEVERIVADYFDSEPKQRDLFGGPKTYSLALLVGLTLKLLRLRTGHSWHEDPFTFEHAKAAVNLLLDEFRPPGKARVPDDLPAALAGTVRRAAKRGDDYSDWQFGVEAALELLDAINAYAGSYGEKRRQVISLMPENEQAPWLFDYNVYSRLGKELNPLRKRVRTGRQTQNSRRGSE